VALSEGPGEALKGGAYRLVLVAGLMASLAANLPGHLSADSVIALEEARSGVRQTWAPAAFSAVLRIFDTLLSGTGLYVAASTGVLFASLMALPALRGRTSWLAVIAAALAILTPQLLIYPGIVWRDVLFADVTLAGFVLLARADTVWAARPPWLSLIGAALCLALGAAVRQNGVVMVLAAAVALAWIARGGWRARLAWGFGGFAAAIAAAFANNAASQPGETAPHLRQGAEARILQHYDIVGAVAHSPGLPLTEIAAASPEAAAKIAAAAPAAYSAARIDSLDADPNFRRTFWKLPDAAVSGQWRDIVLHHPGAYLAHRLEVFRWVLMTPDLGQCLPVQVGVDGPQPMIDGLELDTDPLPKDTALVAYAEHFYGTPVFSHLAWGIAAAVCAGLLLLRRRPGDVPMAGLLAGSIAFALSFLPIAVACDYRYLYLLDLAAIAGVLYLALDIRLVARVRGRVRRA
jgi:hypothetical protein